MLNALENAFIRKTHAGSKERIYKAAYGNKPLNEASLKTSMTQLLGLLLDFMAFSEFQKDKIRQNQYVLKKLNLLRENKHYPKYHHKAVKDIQKADMETADRNYELMRTEEEFHSYVNRQPKRDVGDHLPKAAELLENSFLLRTLRYHLQSASQASSFRKRETSPLTDFVLKFVASHLAEQPVIIKVYYLLACAHRDPSDLQSYSDAKALLSASWEDFAWVEASELYTSALNFAARQLNNGQMEFLPIVFTLYEEMLDRQLLTRAQKMSAWHFKNMVHVRSRAEQV